MIKNALAANASPLVPNGLGGRYCKETTCAAGNSFSTSACGCVPCTDNASCQCPCPDGKAPDGKGGPSSPGKYRAGSRVCFLGNSFAKNAWSASGGCCSHVSCTTVATGHYCQVGSDGILVGGSCPLE